MFNDNIKLNLALTVYTLNIRSNLRPVHYVVLSDVIVSHQRPL